MRGLLLLLLVGTVGAVSMDAVAATLWRKVPMTPYEARHRLHTLNANDVAVARDGTIYMANGLLQRYAEGAWVSVDSLARGLALDEQSGGYKVAVKDPQSRSRLKADGLVRMMDPDRINGIAEKVAIDDQDRLWVVTPRGRVFSGGRDNWRRMPVMAGHVSAGPGGQAVVWTQRAAHRQHEGEHDRWLKNNPHPKLFSNGRWEDVVGLPAPPRALAFDAAGELWALIYAGDEAAGTGRIYQRREGRWQTRPAVTNGRFIDSDLKGNLWVLSYRLHKPEGKNTWSHDQGRVHWWRDGAWYNDRAMPDLPVKPVFAGNHGTLLQFENHLTFAHRSRWLSLKEVSDEEFARVKAHQQPRTARPMPWDEEPSEDDDAGATPPATAPVSAGETRLAGCWLWSNGVSVVIHDDGHVQAGVVQSRWTPGDSAGRYSIEWPPIRDTWTLGAEGRRFQSVSSLNVTLSGERISGDSASPAGQWRRSDGAVLNLAAGGAITAGPYYGSWSAKGADRVVLEWPLVDEVTMEQGGQRLRMRSQFASSSAQRIPCE